MSSYYFQNLDSDFCYSLEYFRENFKGQSIELYPAKKISFPSMMWCKEHQSAGDVGNCGKECESYKPRNGKSGCCVHYTRTFFEPEETPKTFQF